MLSDVPRVRGNVGGWSGRKIPQPRRASRSEGGRHPSRYSAESIQCIRSTHINHYSAFPPRLLLCSASFTEAIGAARKDPTLVTEGRVSEYFQKRLVRGSFKNAALSGPAARLTGGKMCAYITMPKLVAAIGSRAVGPDDLNDETKAKYLYCEGEGEGSLLDLVNKGGKTGFPNTSKGVWEPNQLPAGRRTRTRCENHVDWA